MAFYNITSETGHTFMWWWVDPDLGLDGFDDMLQGAVVEAVSAMDYLPNINEVYSVDFVIEHLDQEKPITAILKPRGYRKSEQLIGWFALIISPKTKAYLERVNVHDVGQAITDYAVMPQDIIDIWNRIF